MPEIEQLFKERDSLRQRVNELGSEYRQRYTTVVSGLVIGLFVAALKGEFTSAGKGGVPLSQIPDVVLYPLVAFGIGAVLVLANTLWSKHRSMREYDLKISEIEAAAGNGRAEKPRRRYFMSVAHFDLISLYFMFSGIMLFIPAMVSCEGFGVLALGLVTTFLFPLVFRAIRGS